MPSAWEIIKGKKGLDVITENLKGKDKSLILDIATSESAVNSAKIFFTVISDEKVKTFDAAYCTGLGMNILGKSACYSLWYFPKIEKIIAIDTADDTYVCIMSYRRDVPKVISSVDSGKVEVVPGVPKA
jgi:hypothetical protein